MRHKTQQILSALGIGALLLAGSLPAGADVAAQKAIGFYMTVIGKTTVVHVGQPPAPVPVKLRGDVYFKDVIETQAAARAKALFEDDSILTVGENSRVEVSEYIYDPSKNRRSTVLRLVQGKARALVGKMFVGLGSRFEVHTPTASTAARGTYFVVWVEDNPGSKSGKNETGGTGIANIGGSGIVAFTSGGRTIDVPPQTYSFAQPGAVPSAPVALAENVPAGVTAAIVGTEVPDAPTHESPSQVAMAMGQAPNQLVVEPGEMLSASNLGTLTLASSRLTASLQDELTPPAVVSGSGLNALRPLVPGGVVPGGGGGGGSGGGGCAGILVLGICIPL